jgi:uncharacterized membrane protein YGL010W
MIIDSTWFGYGAGLVMVGWFCGMVGSVVFTLLGRMR